jgi:hypothetical protein
MSSESKHSAVYDYGIGHHSPEVLQIKIEKLVSFGEQNQTVRSIGSFLASAAGSISVTSRPAPT